MFQMFECMGVTGRWEGYDEGRAGGRSLRLSRSDWAFEGGPLGPNEASRGARRWHSVGGGWGAAGRLGMDWRWV
jgi:hypothetical protein